ncbi:MAG: POTRA domain-containing protein [Acidobacteriaceae bacterium]
MRAILRGIFVYLAMTTISAAVVLPAQEGSLATDPAQRPPSAPIINTGALNQIEGLVVSRIRMISDAPNAAQDKYHLDEERLLQHLTQKPGAKADPAKLRNDLRQLFASGKFTEISLDSLRSGEQVELTYHTLPQYFVGVIYMSGSPPHTSAARLIDSTKLQLGEPVTQTKLDFALQRIKRTLAENGWRQASVATQLQPNSDTQQEQISYQITRGRQARIGRVQFTGEAGQPESELLEISKLKTGDTVGGTTLTRAETRLRKKLQKDNRLEAQVTLTSQQYNPATNTVDYAFTVERGPKVDVSIAGAKLRKSKLKKFIPIYEENAVDTDLLNEGRRNLRDYFQTQGYFNVKVQYQQKLTPGRDDIVYTVDRGERHKIARVEITGNKYFDTQDLRERMAVQPADVLLRRGVFSQANLAHDVTAIENLYKANGFANVKVTSDIVDNYQGKEGDIDVVLHVDEGAQVRIAKLDLEGVAPGSANEVRNLLSDAEPGQPYSPADIASDRDTVLNYYYNHGFPKARFRSTSTPASGAPNRVDLTIRIEEGAQVFVDRTLLYGLRHTRRKTVDRTIQFADGEPLDQSAVLDTQRRLYDLGLFNEVDTAVQDPDGEMLYKNVLLHMQEARRYTFTYGLGFEAQTGLNNSNRCTKTVKNNCNPNGNFGFSPRVEFDVSRINLRGTDQSVTFKGNYGRLQKRALLTYTDPNTFNHPSLTFSASIFYDDTQDVLTFAARRLEGQLAVRQQWTKATSFQYRFAYRRVSVNSLNITPDQVPLFSLPVNVGMPGFTLVRDTRDDPLDSKKGTYNTADIALSSTAFGSHCTGSLISGQNEDLPNQCPDPSFSRLFFQNSTYFAFGKTNRQWVLARSISIGSESPFGYLGGLVPLAERFYAGGANSHRGFAINQAGPRDSTTGYPVGGAALFINSVELRTPPIGLPLVGNNLSAVLFNDLGNTYDTTGHMFSSLLRFSQPDKLACKTNQNAPCNFNYDSAAIGAGLRYRTPIGPVRVDLGYNLNAPLYHGFFPQTDANGIVTDVFGTRHTGRINVFFSIGQTF